MNTSTSTSTLHKELTNYFQMTPEIATSGQPDVGQIKQISDMGYTTVISLVPHTSQDAMPDEGKIVAANFMAYINIPVLYEDPQLEQLKMFCNLLDAMKDQKIWIHCVKNSRVAAFIYLYLRYRRGYPHEQARSPMFDQWTMDETWVEFMEEAIEIMEDSQVSYYEPGRSAVM